MGKMCGLCHFRSHLSHVSNLSSHRPTQTTFFLLALFSAQQYQTWNKIFTLTTRALGNSFVISFFHSFLLYVIFFISVFPSFCWHFPYVTSQYLGVKISQIVCSFPILYSTCKIIKHFVFEVMAVFPDSFIRVKICDSLLLYISSSLVNFFLILFLIPFYDFQRYILSLLQWVINPNAPDGAEKVGFLITTVFIANEHDKCSFLNRRIIRKII